MEAESDATELARSWQRSVARGMSFRRAHSDDMALLRRIYASTRTAEMDVVPWTDAQKSAFIDMQFAAQHEHYSKNYPTLNRLVIGRADEPIGRLYLDRAGPEDCVTDIAILAEHRGRGLGSALMWDLLDDASARGRPMIVYVEKFNPARRLYERLGFVVEEDKGVYDLMRWTPND